MGKEFQAEGTEAAQALGEMAVSEEQQRAGLDGQ